MMSNKTVMITDDRCLSHAGFDNYKNILKRVRHKDDQPENAERLMVLIDNNKGVLTCRDEFVGNEVKSQGLFEVVKKTTEASISDVLRGITLCIMN